MDSTKSETTSTRWRNRRFRPWRTGVRAMRRAGPTPVKLTGRVKARLRALAAAVDCTAHAASVAEREAKTSGGRT